MPHLSALTLACCASLLGSSLAGCALERSADDLDPTDDQAAGATIDPLLPLLARMEADARVDDGLVDASEARGIAAFLDDFGGVNATAKRYLEEALARRPGAFTAEARAFVASRLAGKRPGDASTENAVYRLVAGRDANSVADDELFLLGLGRIDGTTGLVGHSRGYAKVADGVLRKSHGSIAPSHPSMHGPAELSAIRAQTPDKALDAAAKIAGLKLGAFDFGYLANKVHFNPSAPYWAGLCHAWTYTSLDDRLNALVDVDGRRGQLGVWIFGQWISRADLGNWLMGASNAISVADAVLLDSFVTGADWLKGVTQYVMTSGRGLRADLWNDAERGHQEIWNQPIYSASVVVEAVPAATRAAVASYAAADKREWTRLPTSPDVRLVRLTAKWGAEVSDSWEGPTALEETTWNLYAVTDASGRVVRAYPAHLLAQAKVAALTETASAPLPDYFATPKHAAVDAVLAGAADKLVDGSHEGKYYRFFIGTVLARGVPDATLAAFERDAAKPDARVDELAARYPGVANAYAPANWAKRWGATLGDGRKFGAAWPNQGA
jgi:hypothetical protein